MKKLKTKYKKETKKLVGCITSFILNDLTSSQYFSLFKMKDLLDNNEINLKDKYIEFLFYFLKKFEDPDAKLEDLKYSLLNEIVPLGDTTVHSKAFVNKEKDKEEENIDLDNIENLNENEKKEKNENNEADNLRYKKCEEENKQRIKEAKEKQEKYEDYIIIANKEREKYIELSEKINREIIRNKYRI